MNTYKKGDDFENHVFSIFEEELKNDNLSFANSKNSKIFKQKGHYSRDRDSDIRIDVSIEVFHAGTKQLALLIPIECKDYETTISVGRIEEFLKKTDQIAGKNVKAIFASTSNYSSSALKVAQNNNLALIRIIQDNQIEWKSYHALPDDIDKIMKMKYSKNEVFKALTQKSYVGENNGVFGMDGKDWNIGKEVITNALKKN